MGIIAGLGRGMPGRPWPPPAGRPPVRPGAPPSRPAGGRGGRSARSAGASPVGRARDDGPCPGTGRTGCCRDAERRDGPTDARAGGPGRWVVSGSRAAAGASGSSVGRRGAGTSAAGCGAAGSSATGSAGPGAGPGGGRSWRRGPRRRAPPGRSRPAPAWGGRVGSAAALAGALGPAWRRPSWRRLAARLQLGTVLVGEPLDHGGLDRRRRRLDELSHFFELGQDDLALDSELFGELVDSDLSHASPSGPIPGPRWRGGRSDR